MKDPLGFKDTAAEPPPARWPGALHALDKWTRQMRKGKQSLCARAQYAGGCEGSRKMVLLRRMSPTEPKLASVKL